MDNKKTLKRPKPVVLLILDGWGVAQPYSGNAITQANTPIMNELISHYPATVLMASGEAVGLPWGEAGNSEVGHLNIGLGRIVYQDLPRINKAISDGTFYSNKKILEAINRVKRNNKKLHLMGLASNGGVHSSIEHLYSLLALAKQQEVKNVFIHAFIDGRDTPYNSGLTFIQDIEKKCSSLGVGKIATLSGRFYAMDRDNHWDRIKKCFLAITKGEGNHCDSSISAVEKSYEKKIYDEEFIPTVISNKKIFEGSVEDGDAIIFFNFRADRARELTKSFVLPSFNKFKRPKYFKNLYFVCFTEYEDSLPTEVAFPPDEMNNILGEIVSKAGLKQLRIAETEKYAHVTYFLNGGKEDSYKGEDRLLVPSAPVDSYKEKPEMSAPEVTEKLLEVINDNIYDLILVNYANADMVGHTGDLKATIKAIETVDKSIGKVVKAVLKKNGAVIITADHGNAETMFNMQTGSIDKEHSNNPVPFILVGKNYEGKVITNKDVIGSDLSLIQPQGILSDIAPTILKIMKLEKPTEMTGRSLI